ncbi:MAG: sodium:calcium antiporter [Phycisphaerales bacterium]|nr:MAG: sodium:calcium antiporter [Phycisphaerales bacterium]
MPLDLVLLVLGLTLLVVGADLLIFGAKVIALRFGVSRFVVGLTVVAFGTSAPELAGGIGMVLTDRSEMVVATVLGSNIANVCLILGLTAVIRPIPVTLRAVRNDVLIVIAVTLLAAALLLGGELARWESLILCAGIVLYVVRAYRTRTPLDPAQVTRPVAKKRAINTEPAGEAADEPEPPQIAPWRSGGAVLLGTGLLAGGSAMLVSGASGLASNLGVPEFVIALTMVAFGTSVPELATSLRAALKRESDIAIGNVLGSNVFNLLAVLGICGLVAPLRVPIEAVTRDVWVALAAAVACVPIFMTAGRITRAEGLFLLVGYIAYVVLIFAIGV